MMLVNEIMRPYDEYLCGLETFAADNHIPIARFETIRFIETLLAAKRPRRLLEIGTAVAYSTIILTRRMGEGGITDTIENDPEMLRLAAINIDRAGLSDRINLIAGEASDVIRNLDKKYDFVFLDAAKGQYKEMFILLKPLLAPGAVVVSDNILYKGLVGGPETVPHKMRTIVVRMREYIRFICSDPDFVTSISEIGDGIAVSVLI